MPRGVIQYPIEIIDAAQTIMKSSQALNELMGRLTSSKNALMVVSQGAASVAFNEVQDAFNKSGLNNNARLAGVANAATEAQTRMTDFDRFMANRFRGA